MKPFAPFAVAFLLAAVPAAAEKKTVRTVAQTIPAAHAEVFHIEVPVGELTIAGWDGDEVDLTVRFKCKSTSTRCAAAAEKPRVLYRSGEKISVQIKSWPRFGNHDLHAEVTVRVPRHLAVRSELGVGELEIEGLEHDLEAELGVGEVKVDMQRSAVASVTLDTGIGEANLSADGKRFGSAGLFTRTVRWERGGGKARVSVDCGVGEIDVTLR
jgi:hypothetical protein